MWKLKIIDIEKYHSVVQQEIGTKGKAPRKKKRIGHFQKYHNILYLSYKILHKHCLYFLLGPLQVPGENENKVYVKFWKTNKEYYHIFESGLLHCQKALSGYRVQSNKLKDEGKLLPFNPNENFFAGK